MANPRTMQIEQELANITTQEETLLTIGVFYGVHAGHRYLLKRLQQRAGERNLLSGVVTFNPHPQSVLHPDEQLPWLSSLDDRVATFHQLGLNIVAVLTFTSQLARLSACDFMSLLKKSQNARHQCGPQLRFRTSRRRQYRPAPHSGR